MKLVNVLISSALLGFGLSQSALGDAQDKDVYISPMAGVIDKSSRRDFESEIGYQLGIGAALSERWNIEGYLNQYHPDEGVGAQEQRQIGFDFQRVFNRSGRISPYLLFGAGYMEFDPNGGPSGETATFSSGIGFLTDFKRDGGPALRVELRHREHEDFKGADRFLNVGLQFRIGSLRKEPQDSDGDGVIDMVDQCPDTPVGTNVDSRGCPRSLDSDGVDACPRTPADAAVDARGCELDADGDGVVDRLDQCADTVANAEVDANGCERDEDGDSVVDRADRCLGTPRGVAVDVFGCEIRNEIQLPGVNFETNSDVLVPEASQVLRDAAQALINNPGISVEVAGHTDSDGDAAYNQGLSERRARAVRAFLIDRGVEASRLTARGYGESQPVADNSTADGKRQNRRVVLRITSR